MYRQAVQKLVLLLLVCLTLGATTAASARAGEQFVAVVITGDLPRYREAHEAFVGGLSAAGLTAEKVKIYVQTPNPDPLSWLNSIRKAVGVGADLIVTYGAPAALAAKAEARSVPVLFADVYDPVAVGLVKDPLAPGGEMTGISSRTPLETLVRAYREIHPVGRMGVLFSSDDKGSVLQVKHLEAIGGQQGFKLLMQNVTRAGEVPAALNALAGKVDCLFASESALLNLRMEEILSFSERHRLPVLSQTPGLSDRGALITLEADPAEQGQVIAAYAQQVLSGKKANQLPVVTPKKVSLVINLKVAEKLGLKVPFQALSMATRVIR